MLAFVFFIRLFKDLHSRLCFQIKPYTHTHTHTFCFLQANISVISTSRHYHSIVNSVLKSLCQQRDPCNINKQAETCISYDMTKVTDFSSNLANLIKTRSDNVKQSLLSMLECKRYKVICYPNILDLQASRESTPCREHVIHGDATENQKRRKEIPGN